MSEPFICPITDIKISKCDVTECLYWMSSAKNNCIASRGIPEDVEFIEQDLAKSRSISVKDLKKEMALYSKRIQTALILQDFIEYYSKKLKPEDYPSVAGYHDSRLVEYVSNSLCDVFPYSVEKLNWNIGLINISLLDSYWREYANYKKLKFESVERSLGIKQDLILDSRKEFAAASSRAKRNVKG